MWNVHGAYAFHAHEHGATAIVGLDVDPDTEEFRRKNLAAGSPIRFVRGDVNDPAVPDRLGRFDVVFCSGVLYHVPNPIHTLEQLKKLTGRLLILTSASTQSIATPQAAVLVPFLEESERAKLTFRSPRRKVGLDSTFEADKGYGNWFWLPTPSCITAMLRLAGMSVKEEYVSRYVTTIVAAP